MKILLLTIAVAVLCVYSVPFRVLLFSPFLTVFHGIRDIYKYFRYRKWNNFKTGKITCFVGLFGKGKTLSAVHYVTGIYRRYNNRKVYDESRKKWVVQKVHIVSNVELSIPYEQFTSLAQMLYIARNYGRIDAENDTLTVHIFLGDEFSVQLNSRSFKSNIDPLFLNTLLTCRHHHMSLVYTAQRFGHVDALLRQVTGTVTTCNKQWRVMEYANYDAYEMENANNPLMVKPFFHSGWFIRDRDFSAYDTLACVGNLSKSCLESDMLSEEEILAHQCNTPSDMDSVDKPSRKYKKRMKRMVKK